MWDTLWIGSKSMVSYFSTPHVVAYASLRLSGSLWPSYTGLWGLRPLGPSGLESVLYRLVWPFGPKESSRTMSVLHVAKQSFNTWVGSVNTVQFIWNLYCSCIGIPRFPIRNRMWYAGYVYVLGQKNFNSFLARFLEKSEIHFQPENWKFFQLRNDVELVLLLQLVIWNKMKIP